MQYMYSSFWHLQLIWLKLYKYRSHTIYLNCTPYPSPLTESPVYSAAITSSDDQIV